MLIKVLSRDHAEDFTRRDPAEKTAIISISDIGEPDADLNEQPNIVSILRVNFNDAYEGEEGCINGRDARAIARFVNRNRNAVKQIIVHCGAGISRSAGVGSAIAFVLNHDHNDLIHGKGFIPNTTVFRAVLKAFMELFPNNSEL